MLVMAICKILLDKDYSFSLEFVPVALEQLWVKTCGTTHKSHLQSMSWVSYLAVGQSPTAGCNGQSVLAVGFGLYGGSNLSWVRADWCGNVLKEDAVSAGRCPWLDNDSSTSGLLNWNHIWYSKTVILLTSAEVLDFQGNLCWLGMSLWWLITKISLHRTTKIFHAGDGLKGIK